MIIQTQADVTPKVLAELQRADNPRFLQVIESLVTHLHAFARDVRLTEEEFHLACAYQRDRQGHDREPQRGGAHGRIVGAVRFGVPIEQRRSRSDRNHCQSTRAVLAAGIAADTQ